MVDTELKPGDVAIDLVKRGKVQILEQASHSVGAYRAQEDFDLATYKSHPLLNVSETEPVYTCVYLPDEPTTSFSGTYDFPASRLARVPVEEANQDYDRIQTDIVINLFANLFESALVADESGEHSPDSFEQAIRFCWTLDTDVLETGYELARAGRFGDGGGES